MEFGISPEEKAGRFNSATGLEFYTIVKFDLAVCLFAFSLLLLPLPLYGVPEIQQAALQ